ncbi:GH36-type glycosyl hydrolase domain-containing protein [Anaerosporobacter sp.]|uniref:GH36-type glycosyl hydrolase domain-containing protein n=1 Tax=Anaerosporobacter sp. TaxID=1872529 RepID=UPI00286F3AD8|nr:GH116 family glycosyl hydrolase [Anaerosporobacter sp.]
MKYGHFDVANKEYCIDRVDLPTSWTNYLGVKDFVVVVNHTAGGYAFYKSPEYHRITRFRGNSVPMDRPGHYVYIRDDQSEDYWSVSWQPTNKSLEEYSYSCRHGMSYSVYECEHDKIKAKQTLVVPINDNVELWDVTIKNEDDKVRELSLFSYCEFSYHHIMIDNQNYQMSLYCAGSNYENSIIEYDLFYEEFGYQYFTATFEPDSYDCLRDSFLGLYHTENNPVAVERGQCSNSSELGNNHCGSLHKKITLQPGEEIRVVYMLGEGNREEGKRIREKYSDLKNVDAVYTDLKNYWDEKFKCLQIQTPNEGMNVLINTWNLYQSEINVMFSRFASFIELGGRTGLGFRDTAQDAMTIPHSNPTKCKERIIQLLQGTVSKGYGLHLFQPEWFEKDDKEKKEPFKSPTVIPKAGKDDIVHGLEDACSDDALWLIASIVEYIKETGENELVDQMISYADGGEGTVYEHMEKILEFSYEQVGNTGICKGLRADWNDCLNLGGGESAMVSFLHYWALDKFIELSEMLGRKEEVEKYSNMAQEVKAVCNDVLWDGDWFIRGITKEGNKIGTSTDVEGKVHLESNAWAVLSGAANTENATKAMDSVYEYLFTPYGLQLNAPSYTKPNDSIGFVTRVYPGLKENGAIFSHPNPWAWAAECILGRGDRAMELYNSLCPYNQNDMIEIREAEPYSYCQFVVGPDHTAFGRARHPFMTGSSGWAYFSATRYILGIRPGFDSLEIDPCIPSDWKEFDVTRVWRGATFNIHVTNPDGVMKGIKTITVDGNEVEKITAQAPNTTHTVEIVMG